MKVDPRRAEVTVKAAAALPLPQKDHLHHPDPNRHLTQKNQRLKIKV
jgi:hypothetical protein